MLKRPKHIGRRGGGSTSAPSTDAKKGLASGKIINKKGVGLSVDGASEIASPDDPAAYVDQCRFVSWWFTTSFKRAKSDNKKSAGEVRDKLETLLFLSLNELLALARDGESPANAWAGKLLAYVDAIIAGSKKFLDTNKTYQQERLQLGKLLRTDVWFPKLPLSQALHRELWHCWYYRGELAWPLVQPKWEANEYQPFMKLPPLSLSSWRKWDKPLWSLVKKHNPQLQAELQRRNKRVQSQTRLSKYRKEFQQHLHTIVAAQSRGILPG